MALKKLLEHTRNNDERYKIQHVLETITPTQWIKLAEQDPVSVISAMHTWSVVVKGDQYELYQIILKKSPEVISWVPKCALSKEQYQSLCDIPECRKHLEQLEEEKKQKERMLEEDIKKFLESIE